MMRLVLAAVVFVHAVAHLPGFLVGWDLRSFPELPFRTTILDGSIDVGVVGAKVVGLAWLALSLAFVVIGLTVLMRPTWWPGFTYGTIALSMALCIVGWPETRIGLVANALILVLVVAYRKGL